MKRIGVILLSVSLAWSLNLRAGDTISNYFCDFEDEVQNLTWHFPANPSNSHHWTIGEAINNGGKRSLYVRPNDLDTTTYVNTPAFVYAYTDITLAKSSEKYTLSFDWIAAGYTLGATDGLYVFWVPDKDDLGDSIYISDQTTFMLSPTLKAYALPLNPAMTCPDSLCGKSTWQAWISEKTSVTDSRIAGGRHRRLVFAWRNGTGGPVNPAACIDNIAIVDSRACGATTDLTVSTLGEDSLVMDWKGEANSYEVGCYSYEKKSWQVVRVDTTHYVYTDVPEGFTDFYVRSICYDTITEGEYFSAKQQYSQFIYYPGNHCIDYITLSEENCYISTVKTNYVTEDYKFKNEIVDNGSDDKYSRHTHHYSKTETDVNTGGRLRTVPAGEIASTRLGNWNNGGEAERAEFKFHVDAKQNPILVMKYAVVLESPGHDEGKFKFSKNLQDPRFTLDVLSKGKSIGPCAAADYTSSWVSTGWNDTTVITPDGKKNVVWKDWTTVGVNLEDYDGEDLTIRLTTFDCSMTAHFGYAYFTLGCAKKELEGQNCDGKPSTDFSAPAGFNYRWYLRDDPEKTVLATTQTFQIDSMDSRPYNVDVIFPEDSLCFFTLEASSMPRYPVADFTYQHAPGLCHNYMLIHNNSRVETVNLATKDTTYSDVERVEWDFGAGIGYPIEAGKAGLIEFPAEGGIFPVTVTAYAKNCEASQTNYIVVPPIGEQTTDTTVYRCPGEPYYFVGHNADGSTVRNADPYTEFGVYQDTLVATTGCDSIIRTTLDILKPVFVGNDVVILEGDTFMYYGKPIIATGLYRDTLRSVHGCDSIIDSLSLYVHEFIVPQMPARDSICSDAGQWVIPFRIMQGISCDSYSLLWDEKIAGLPSIKEAPLPADSIFRLTMPADMHPNYYHAHFVFHDTLAYLSPQIKDGKADVTLQAMYPEEVIAQRWNDVLAIRNAEYNGGYVFDSVQWYVGKEPIEQAIDFNYYAGDGKTLRFGEEYRALLKRNDGVWLFTCAYVPAKVDEKIMDMPSLVPPSSQLFVKGRGTATWYDLSGRPLTTQAYDASSIITPAATGCYLLVLDEAATRTVHRMIVR